MRRRTKPPAPVSGRVPCRYREIRIFRSFAYIHMLMQVLRNEEIWRRQRQQLQQHHQGTRDDYLPVASSSSSSNNGGGGGFRFQKDYYCMYVQ